MQVLQDLFYVLLHVLFYLRSLLKYRSDRRLQRRFPFDDILLRSGDIRDRDAKLSEITPKFRRS